MSRINELRERVEHLYQAKSSDRTDWADWLFEHHIFVVSKNASDLAERFGGDKELAMAAAMLHDVADAVMHRGDERHEEESFKIARRLLQECDFSEEEIRCIIDDAIRFHGCHDENVPKTLEGKIMATADAMAHLQTDFYDRALWVMQETQTMSDIRGWALPKIERDYHKKVFFDVIRTEIKDDYNRVKRLFTE